MKATVAILGFFIGLFGFLGGLSVLVGLGASFVAFIFVNLGIGSFGWIRRRRIMMAAEEQASQIKAGGKKLGGTIEALGDAAEALKKIR